MQTKTIHAVLLLSIASACAGCPSPAARQTSTSESDIDGTYDIGGYALYLRCQGTGAPTIILDAGTPETSQTWVDIQPRLAASHRVCAYDRAGLGKSQPAPGARTITRMTEELRALLREAGVRGPYVLVGHSFGGMIARLFARRFPELVHGLVLVDPAHELFLVRLEQELPEQQWAFFDMVQKHMPEHVDWRKTVDEFRSAGAPRDWPMIVISAGRPAEGMQVPPDFPGDFPLETMTRIIGELHESIAAESSRGMRILAIESGHHVHHQQPDLVVQSILEVAGTTIR